MLGKSSGGKRRESTRLLSRVNALRRQDALLTTGKRRGARSELRASLTKLEHYLPAYHELIRNSLSAPKTSALMMQSYPDRAVRGGSCPAPGAAEVAIPVDEQPNNGGLYEWQR